MSPFMLVLFVVLTILELSWSIFYPPPTGCMPIDPPPSHQVCGTAGDVPDNFSKFADPQFASDLDECHSLCLRRVDTRTPKGHIHQYLCGGFSYDAKTQICQLYSFSSIGQPNNASSDSVFYQYSCFKCPPPCPLAIGTQLLDNGDFELSHNITYLGPWSYQGDSSSSSLVSPGRHSKQAYYCNLSEPSNSGICGLQQFINDYKCRNTHVLLLKFDVKTNAVESGGVDLQVFAGGSQYNLLGKKGTGGIWRTVELYFSANHAPLAFYMNYRYGSLGRYYLDNVEVSAVQTPLKTRNTAVEVIRNGGFMTNELEPWSIANLEDSSVSIASPGLDRTPTALKWQFDTITAKLKLQQTLATSAGTKYLLRFLYLNPDSPRIDMIVYLGEPGDRDNSTVPADYTYVYLHLDRTKTEMSYEFPFVAIKRNSVITLEVLYVFGVHGGNVTFDEFSLKELA